MKPSKRKQPSEQDLAHARRHVQEWIDADPNGLTQKFITGNDAAREKIVGEHATRIANNTAHMGTVSELAQAEHKAHLERTVAAANGTARNFTKITAGEYEELSFKKKLKTARRANWAEASKAEKGIRLAASAVGLGVIIVGATNLLRGIGVISPKMDPETGQAETSKMGALVKGVIEVPAGLAIGAAALSAGGRNRAILK